MIETQNLLVRQYSLQDIDELFPILSNAKTMSFWPSPFTWDDVRAWINRSLESQVHPGLGRCAVVLKETQKIIGDCGIVKVTIDGELVNDLGYIIHHHYWGNGYATEAAIALKDYGFNRLNLDALYANMPYNHDASRRVAEKLGMQKIKEFDNPRNRGIRTFLYAVYQNS